ncbi:MAG: CBASS cGAMP synthase [Pseudomonadota bacterium]
MTVNAHAAFENSTDNSYRKNLTPSDAEINELRDARDKVRATLKSAFSDWEGRMDAGVLFEDSVAVAFSADAQKPSLSPKFRGQGSYQYRTLNQPTQNPPQEMDFDDGMFLPTSFMSQNGRVHPSVASDGYFRLVEEALAPLCAKEGWSLPDDKDKKDSCVRVILNNGRSHLDVALYAIPDDQYEILVEKALNSTNNVFTADQSSNLQFMDQIYETIDPDQIMLAHRKEGWKISDPRLLERWFLSAINEHGEQLRRVCRFLKGWRDHSWEKCRLSSIALMACVVKFYNESIDDFVGRDDLALLAVSKKLPGYLSQEIVNPVVEGRLDEGWDDGDEPCRAEFVAQSEQFQSKLSSALATTGKAETLAQLADLFGIHFPKDEGLIVVDGESQESASTSAAILGSLGSAEDTSSAVKIGGNERYG